MKWALWLGLASGLAGAQSVDVYSEFAKLNDAGEVMAPENPREILSPAVARNAFSSFQLAIQVPAGVEFTVYIGQNPDNAAKVTLYRRKGGKLERVESPYVGESSQVLWMDLWEDANAAVRRVKIEPQIGIDGQWLTYPMEVRVTEVVIPKHSAPARGAAEAFEVMRAFLCGGEPSTARGVLPMGAELRFRNALQDVALAAASSGAVRDELKKAMGGCSADQPADPEFYLRIRDLLFTARAGKAR
ncbi:MAG: hypothetical protein ABI833_14895 [Acidobacteriota bacterium]